MEIPFGECHCGCHGRAPIATRNWFSKGIIKGQPMKFIRGHRALPNIKRWEVIDCGFETPCWIWIMFSREKSYGQRTVNGHVLGAHIAAWETVNGLVPKGKQVHHKCRVKLCVNPDHLEALTPKEHGQRHNDKRICCKRGHPFDKENTYWTNRGRYCRTCKAARSREWHRKVQRGGLQSLPR